MHDDLLEKAREHAGQAESPIRAAALLRIARAESAGAPSRARQTLLEGLDAVRQLPAYRGQHLLHEARQVAAAVDPDLLAGIESARFDKSAQPDFFERAEISAIVAIMLAHRGVGAAFDYLMHYEDPASFPFPIVANVLHVLKRNDPDNVSRRLTLLRHAIEVWTRNPSSGQPFGRFCSVEPLFERWWNELPAEEALGVARTIVARILEDPDTPTSARHTDEVRFTSSRQNSLFEILHVLRHLDPTLAQSLIDSCDELAAAARRFPNGIETMLEEAAAELERRKAAGEIKEGGGYLLHGNPNDFPRQRLAIDAARSGNFDPSIEGALEVFRKDTSSAKPNGAPKEYWPSTGEFRTIFHEAGRRIGPDASRLLERIPDADLRLFATIELAAALAGVPAPASILKMG